MTMKMIRYITLFSFLVLSLCACSKSENEDVVNKPEIPEKESNHPFLIVKKDMYPALREKASQEPWKSMKADAIKRSAAGSSNDAYKLQEYIGAAALAYILDEGNEIKHANRVRDAILNNYSKLEIEESGDWGKVVKPMGSFFSAILALDIVYDALSAEDIAACENVIENQIFKVKRTGSWVDVRYGTHGTWDIYKGVMTTPNNAYYEGIMKQITPDGVSPVTNHYAWERVGGGDSRVSKSGFMDVLEFTGIDKRYYNNERLQKFYRWLFGSSINCNKEMAIFGDMLPTQGIGNYLLHRRVVNFDAESAGYAAWYLEGKPAAGHILTYIVPKEKLPEPVVPSSKIYENGGAFFREADDDPKGMQAVLYNIKSQDEWHTHNEVNGLSLSALGNRLLVNGGRLGEPTRAAFLNNTLTINGNNHDSRLGGGISTGFISDGLDFAMGNDGPAIANASHNRNLLMIHSDNNTQGYFIVFDEVKAQVNDKIKNYLHPANESDIEVVVPLSEYIAKIDHYPTVSGTSVCFYYVTPPEEVNIEKVAGAVPDRYPGYPDHNRLEAVYNTNSEGIKSLATAIFPYDVSKPLAGFESLNTAEFNGCTITQNGISDFIFETESDKELVSNTITFNARFCLVRKSLTNVEFCFARNGTKLLSDNVGFEATTPVTIYVRGTKGAVISNGGRIKLYGNGIENIHFTPSVNVLETGNGFIEVELDDGTYTFNE